jgi:predicted nucleotidyltransferase
MTTPAQAALIEAIRRTLEADNRVEAAWLSGSFGKGDADDFSDVDVLVLVKAPWKDAADAYANDVSAIAEAVLLNPLFGGRVLNVVTADWERFDLSFVEAGDLAHHDRAALKPLFNRTGAEPPLREHRPYPPPAEKIAGMIREFLRVLGLMPVAFGREEYVISAWGVEMQRRGLIDLMIEANRIAPEDRGGALHLRRLVTPEQHAQLAALPPVSTDPAALAAINLEIARLYLPLARQLAAEVGAEWPEALEQATRRRLKSALGLEI